MAARLGLSKEEIRRLVLGKLNVVYRDLGIEPTPFALAEARVRARRDDPRAFVVALVAAPLGGVSEAIGRPPSGRAGEPTRTIPAQSEGAARHRPL